jgi:hypothetical protein
MSGRRSGGFGRLGPWSARLELLEMYGADAEVGRDLIGFHDEHYRTPWPFELVYVRLAVKRDHDGEYVYPAGVAAEALLSALGALVDRYGLARLGRDDEMDWVHRWAILRAELGESVDPDMIVSSLGQGYMVPDPAGSVPWKPDREPRSVAERRAREMGTPRRIVRESLRAEQHRWEAAGWDFPVDAPEARKHLRWLYLAIRHDWTYGEVAQDWSADQPEPVDDETVAKAVKRLASKAYVTLRGPGPRRGR